MCDKLRVYYIRSRVPAYVYFILIYLAFKNSGLVLDYNVYSELRAKCKYLSKAIYFSYVVFTKPNMDYSIHPVIFGIMSMNLRQNILKKTLKFLLPFILVVSRFLVLRCLLTCSQTIFYLFWIHIPRLNPRYLVFLNRLLIFLIIVFSLLLIFLMRFQSWNLKPLLFCILTPFLHVFF